MKITLITTAFNSSLTLRDTFRSVLCQSFTDIEYIIIDGGSSDETLAIIIEFKKEFKGKLHWISEKDQGIYDAMNKGLRMATGDVVGILNSDDFFTSNDVLERVAREFEDNKNLEAVYGDVHYVRPDNLERCVRYYSSRVFKRERMKMGFMPAHPSFYVRRSCYAKYGLYRTDYKICADFELLLRFIYVNNINIKYLPMDMVTMRTGGASTSGLKSHLMIFKEHLRALKANKISTNVFYLSLRYLYKLTEFYK